MKAVLQNTILSLLGLASVVVLAAPHQSKRSNSCNRNLVTMQACAVNCSIAINAEQAQPVTHDTASFLYW